MEKIEILGKALWSLKDIQTYFGCGRTSASKMMKAAKKIKVNRYLPSKAKRDILLEINGLDFKEELTKLQLLEG